jgi:hypothetical protein
VTAKFYCTRCGATILEKTAEQCVGACMPCFKSLHNGRTPHQLRSIRERGDEAIEELWASFQTSRFPSGLGGEEVSGICITSPILMLPAASHPISQPASSTQGGFELPKRVSTSSLSSSLSTRPSKPRTLRACRDSPSPYLGKSNTPANKRLQLTGPSVDQSTLGSIWQ